MRQHIFSNLLLRSRLFLVDVTCIMHQSPLLILPLRLTQKCILKAIIYLQVENSFLFLSVHAYG